MRQLVANNIQKLINIQKTLKERWKTTQLKLESQERKLIMDIKENIRLNQPIVTKADKGISQYSLVSWQRITTQDLKQPHWVTHSQYYTWTVFKSHFNSSQADLRYSCVLLVPNRSTGLRLTFLRRIPSLISLWHGPHQQGASIVVTLSPNHCIATVAARTQ
jgi:hypothetical protein